jgi:hypothetical protein
MRTPVVTQVAAGVRLFYDRESSTTSVRENQSVVHSILLKYKTGRLLAAFPVRVTTKRVG